MGKFQFKQFSIENNRSAMKVGTDAVLLGSWMRVEPKDSNLLDIGCGTGIISLMAAQRTPSAQILGIDIDSISCEEAINNIINSPWSDRVKALNVSLQDFTQTIDIKYDHIFSNPPFFINSLKSTELRKSNARHTDSLPFDVIIKAIDRLLSDNGRFSIILPYNEANIFIEEALSAVNLRLARRTNVYTAENKPVKRALLEFVRECDFKGLMETGLVIQSQGRYTEDYIKLTKNFHPFLEC